MWLLIEGIGSNYAILIGFGLGGDWFWFICYDDFIDVGFCDYDFWDTTIGFGIGIDIFIYFG